MGTVVMLENNMIVKWNNEPEDVEDMLNEIRLQNAAVAIGLAPKILGYYRERDYFYVFMENLVAKGYKTVWELYHKDGELKVPNNVLRLTAKGICKLNQMGISHGDIHAENVFYNSKKKKVMFIDFGMAEQHAYPEDALENEVDELDRILEEFYEEELELDTNWGTFGTMLWNLQGKCDSMKDSKKKKKKKKKSSKKRRQKRRSRKRQ